VRIFWHPKYEKCPEPTGGRTKRLEESDPDRLFYQCQC